MDKVLAIEHEKCTGCRLCELVCSVKHDGVSNPARSRIRVMKWEAEGLYIPMACRQCDDAPCLNICPVKAISRDQELDFVRVDHDICIGCRSCVAICPFGAMGYNSIDSKVIKCDLCHGDPQCVRFCDVKAVNYVSTTQINLNKSREFAKKISVVSKEAEAL
ncbi:MAG: 4Fe-4S dicluster domain-containing protein [Deltaproteobacteria bacterium]|nr:4Fe-4S dicluster domain-containing protein [Deltaproteobacteria bacterium]MBT4265663.1 4Fe-4S dicluster domain-containing protein [Deltaproteobacteria bacterium]MBT4640996.1 4Fe-4S dicluster domain-containing protein [Deltaproteobacteria bacterium]MBT6498776.1 4Fe-4S dicluster domain-containing protein [Deltaproteobacteria bacterium]MBT6613256.1 4Fe-4S dicluster domain-containing protein [Deltaproteobacteria bacterium]